MVKQMLSTLNGYFEVQEQKYHMPQGVPLEDKHFEQSEVVKRQDAYEQWTKMRVKPTRYDIQMTQLSSTNLDVENQGNQSLGVKGKPD